MFDTQTGSPIAKARCEINVIKLSIVAITGEFGDSSFLNNL